MKIPDTLTERLSANANILKAEKKIVKFIESQMLVAGFEI